MCHPHEDQPPYAPPRVSIPKPNAPPIPTPLPSSTSQYETVAQHTRSRSPHTVDQPSPRLNKTPATVPIAMRTHSQTAAMASVITPSQAAQQQFPAKFLQSMEMPVLHETSRQSLKYRQLHKNPKFAHIWNNYYANELGRLCQGIGQGSKGPKHQRVEVTHTFRLIKFEDTPQDRRREIFHFMFVYEVKPHKEYPNRTCITVAGSQNFYPGDEGTPTGSLDLIKLTINSVMLRRNAHFV